MVDETEGGQVEPEVVTITEPRSTFSQIMEGLGFFLFCVLIAGVMITLVLVWIDHSSNSDFRSNVSTTRDELFSVKRQNDSIEYRLRSLERAHDEDHPDKKLEQSSSGWTTCAGSACSFVIR